MSTPIGSPRRRAPRVLGQVLTLGGGARREERLDVLHERGANEIRGPEECRVGGAVEGGSRYLKSGWPYSCRNSAACFAAKSKACAGVGAMFLSLIERK